MLISSVFYDEYINGDLIKESNNPDSFKVVFHEHNLQIHE